VNRRLVVVRHAKSDRPDGVPDELRPLGGRGRRDAPAVGRWLREHVGAVDVVVCSPAVRARQTWELAAPALGGAPAPLVDPRVYEATAGELLEVVHGLPDPATTAVLVGHNPGLERLVAVLGGVAAAMRTSSIALLEWPGTWAGAAPGGITLAAHATPRG